MAASFALMIVCVFSCPEAFMYMGVLVGECITAAPSQGRSFCWIRLCKSMRRGCVGVAMEWVVGVQWLFVFECPCRLYLCGP